MKNNLLKILLIQIILNFSCNQSNVATKKRTRLSIQYRMDVANAESCYKMKDYLKSGQLYNLAFYKFNNIGTTYDRFNSACSWSMANKNDSAFNQLFILVDKMNYSDYNFIIQEDDFNLLHNDKRWNEIIKKILSNRDLIEAKLDKELVKTLDTIFNNDQKDRQRYTDYDRQHNDLAAKLIWDTIQLKDKINLQKVEAILNKYGWVGSDKVGVRGNSTLFLVIQHADIKIQDKYLPILKKAVEDGNANETELAYLIDRIELSHFRKQIFGTQLEKNNKGLYVLCPTIDSLNLNNRRDSIGLEPIEYYMKNFNY